MCVCKETDLANIWLIVKADCHADVGRSSQGSMRPAALFCSDCVLSPKSLAVIYVVVHPLVYTIVTGACCRLRKYPLPQRPVV